MVSRNIYSSPEQEIKIFSTLDDENVVRYYENFKCLETVIMVMELCGGNVEQVCC